MSIQSFSRLAQIYLKLCWKVKFVGWASLRENFEQKVERSVLLPRSKSALLCHFATSGQWVSRRPPQLCLLLHSITPRPLQHLLLSFSRIIRGRGHILGNIVGSFPDRRIKKRAKDWPPWSQSHRKTDFHFGPPTAPTLCLLVFIPLWPYLFYAWRGKIQN